MGTPDTALAPGERVRTGVRKVGLWAIPLEPDISDFEPRVRKTHQSRARGRQLPPRHTPGFTNARLDLHVLAAHRRLEHKGSPASASCRTSKPPRNVSRMSSTGKGRSC